MGSIIKKILNLSSSLLGIKKKNYVNTSTNIVVVEICFEQQV